MPRRLKLRFVTLLTFARFPLVLLFFAGALYYTNHPSPRVFFASMAALVFSAVTDLFDGYFARRFNVETDFGAHADPLMDKFYYLSTLPLIVYVAALNGHVRHAAFLLVMTVLFLSRDQWVTFLRSIGSMYNVSGGANWSGKLRTLINFPLICLIYYYEEAPEHLQFLRAPWIYAMEAAATVVNLASLYIYTRYYWPYLRRSANIEPLDGADQEAP